MLEEKDKKILRELVKNGRISFADLGRKCHMTRQSVFSRIKSLKNRGVIRNFTVDLDERKLGLHLKAYVLVETELRKFRENVIIPLKASQQISQIHHLFGRFGFLMEVVVKDVDELSDVVSKIQSLELVRRTETMIVFQTEKNMPHHPAEGILS